jgi:hypothetical protein
VQSYDAENELYHIIPAWRVADEGKVHAYLHIESVFKDTPTAEGVKRVSAAELFANIFPNGTRVSTPFGAGEVAAYDVEAGNYKVTLDWEMAEGAHPFVFAQPEVV